MSKLYFKYGTMNSSKSANLLMTKHSYEELKMTVLLIKPSIDTRDGIGIVKSRVGIQSPCLIIKPNDNILELDWMNYDVVMVDEAQFLSKEQVNQLYEISMSKTVFCFGLLTDFKQELFEGSKRLVELSETFEKIDMVCSCGNSANYNARFDENDNFISVGDQIMIGGNDKYKACCKICYEKYKKFGKVN